VEGNEAGMAGRKSVNNALLPETMDTCEETGGKPPVRIKIEGMNLVTSDQANKRAKVKPNTIDSTSDRKETETEEADGKKTSSVLEVSSASSPNEDRELILVYPDRRLTDNVIRQVCEGLHLEELGGSLLGVEDATEAPTNQHNNGQPGGKHAAHIREDQMFRLEKGQLLNDEQINFIIKWYVYVEIDLHLWERDVLSHCHMCGKDSSIRESTYWKCVVLAFTFLDQPHRGQALC